jgi:hypothetical protein
MSDRGATGAVGDEETIAEPTWLPEPDNCRTVSDSGQHPDHYRGQE